MNLDTLLDREFPGRHATPENAASCVVHLNHAGVAPWPVCAADAVREFARENLDAGAMNYAEWDLRIEEVRGRLAAMMNADPGEIALTKNTSEGLSIVAAGLDWRPGDNVVFGAREFPSNRRVWESLGGRFGVEARGVDLSASESPEAALTRAMDDNTRLLAVSSVQFTDGHRPDLRALAGQCKKRGALLCVDAIQSLGATKFDVREYGVDFACADGHKWLLAPESTGVLYCRRALLDELRLSQYGWRTGENPYDYESTQWRQAGDARRLECGSLNNLGLRGLHASLGMFFDAGLERVYAGVARNAEYLLGNFDPSLFECLTPQAPGKRAGIVTLRPRKADARALFKHLLKRRVFCALRAGGVRFSPHFHTSATQMDYALAQLHAAARQPKT